MSQRFFRFWVIAILAIWISDRVSDGIELSFLVTVVLGFTSAITFEYGILRKENQRDEEELVRLKEKLDVYQNIFGVQHLDSKIQEALRLLAMEAREKREDLDLFSNRGLDGLSHLSILPKKVLCEGGSTRTRLFF